jgi:hypothetical protein
MKNYLIISSIGIMALFSSIQPGMPFYAAYPPFGLPTLLFLGLSSYMLLVGMLGTAANVSRDSELRQEIYKGIEVNSDILKKTCYWPTFSITNCRRGSIFSICEINYN